MAAGTAFAGVRPGRVLGPAGACLEAVFPGALLKQAGWGVCGAVVRALIRDPRRQAHRRARSAQPAGRAVTLPAQPGTSS